MKIDAAAEALKEVQSGMTLGLGTGSTAREFVRLLGEKIATGELASIRALCTSVETERQAAGCGVEILEPKHLPEIALAVDGADEIDPELRLVKGLGGALLREKIVEQASARFVVIADETKLVDRLGRGVLPVEVTRFAMPLLEERFRRMGIDPKLRAKNGEPFTTDEQHLILDVRLPAGRDMADFVDELVRFAGVVDTGFFPFEATEAIVATPAGPRRLRRGEASRSGFRHPS
ncbi:MAG: ribose-5-phosphate isomerase RpiA [Acidobacteria bacterium]|nr:ribose-5-phosphate isomerase RpiA [Acidobacteriota bacterium]